MKKIDTVKRKKIDQAANFLEELTWLIDSKRSSALKDLPTLLRTLYVSDVSDTLTNKYSSDNQNKNVLVGILPNLFLDNELFRSNADLADFSMSVLSVPIARHEKRSRFEIIGLIVCEVPRLDDIKLSNLVKALTMITTSADTLKEVKKAKKNADFSWNDTIQKLTQS